MTFFDSRGLDKITSLGKVDFRAYSCNYPGVKDWIGKLNFYPPLETILVHDLIALGSNHETSFSGRRKQW